MIDIDDFKAYNDSYGHQQGDECLRKVARTLAVSLKRPGDFIARYGGEEFIAILADTPTEGALALSEAMRAAVQELGIRHPCSRGCASVTVSLGVACASPTTASKPSDLVLAADQALYEAKNEGRNRVRWKKMEEKVEPCAVAPSNGRGLPPGDAQGDAPEAVSGDAPMSRETKRTVRAPSDLEELIPSFLENTMEEVRDLEEALDGRDYESIRLLGHSIKGSSLSFGFEEMGRLGRSLENAAVERAPFEELRELIGELRSWAEESEIVYF
jgi:diguanylate cyclase (GGDEF)-like protein